MITLKNNTKTVAGVPLTPLIDMVFLLIIFFLLTTSFITEEGISIKLPHADSATPQAQREITVHVSKEGKVFIGRKEFTLMELHEEIRSLVGSDKGQSVVVKADRDVALNKAVRVMDIAKTAGAARLFIATQKEDVHD